MYRFPDTELALREVIQGAVDADVVLFLAADFHEHLPMISVRALPSNGGTEDFLRTDRLAVDVYATGRSAARDLAASIREAVIGTKETSQGLLDDVYVELEPHEAPYASDTVSLYSAVYRADTRPLP